MGYILMPGGGGGADTSVVTASASDVVSGKVIVDADGEPITGTLSLSGNADTADVLKDKTFYTTDPKTKLTGTMESLAGGTYTPSSSIQTISCSGKKMTSNIVLNAIPSGYKRIEVPESPIEISDFIKTSAIPYRKNTTIPVGDYFNIKMELIPLIDGIDYIIMFVFRNDTNGRYWFTGGMFYSKGFDYMYDSSSPWRDVPFNTEIYVNKAYYLHIGFGLLPFAPYNDKYVINVYSSCIDDTYVDTVTDKSFGFLLYAKLYS